MTNYFKLHSYKRYYLLLLHCLALQACDKKDATPGFLNEVIKYQNVTQDAYVGKGLWIGPPLELNESTLPVVCSIVAVRDEFGKPADQLRYPLQTRFWKNELTGEEKELKELKSKFKYVSRPAMDIDPANGRLIIYPEARPDQLLPGTYDLDILVKGAGTERLLKNAIKLKVIGSPPFTYEKNTINDEYVSGYKANDYIIEFKKLSGDEERLFVKLEGPDGKMVNPVLFRSEPNYHKNSGFDKMIGINPYKYTAFSDHLDLRVIYPLPFPNGAYMQDIHLTTAYKDSSWLAIYFSFAIYEPGTWEMKIKFKGDAKNFNDFIKKIQP